MNDYLSCKIKLISFWAILMVVCIHAYSLRFFFNDNSTLYFLNVFVQNFLSQGVARVAVPIFFFFSGYLFFYNFVFDFIFFLSKIRTRFRTLLVPYFIWSVFGFLVYFFLQSFPISRSFFSKDLIIDHSFSDILFALVVDPFSYQFWFIRDLIIVVLFSPIICWLINRFTIAYFLFISLFWFLNYDFFLFKSESLLFFSVGCLASLQFQHIVLKRYSLKFSFIFIFFWLFVLVVKTFLLFQFSLDFWIVMFLLKLSIIAGFPSVLLGFDVLFKKINIKSFSSHSLFSFSFFIFCFHEPLLTIIVKGLVFLFSSNFGLFLYILSILLTVAVCLSFGFFMKRNLRTFYGIVTGSR